MARSRKQISGDQTVHYVPPRLKRGRPRPRLQPPLTPMIDVTFQLLLFFLLTTTFRHEGHILGTLPQKGGIAAGQIVELRPIRIMLRPTGIDRTGCIYEISGHGVGTDSPRQLYEVLRARQRAVESDELPVIIQPRPDVRWRYVVEAFNQAVRAKFKNVGFVSSV